MTAPSPTLAAVTPAKASLDASVRDGIAHAVMLGAGETYLGPLGIFLRATTLQIGLLATLPPFLGAAAQWLGALAMERLRGRRRVIVIGAALQALTWVPIALLALTGSSTRVSLLIAAVTLYFSLGGFIVPLWNSLIGDLVPQGMRGRYFGGRNRLTGMSTFLALLAAGLVLDLTKRTGGAGWGFALIFSVAAAARLISARWLARHEDPPFQATAAQRVSFRQFLLGAEYRDFTRFVCFFSAVHIGVAFSSPYFALYMLRDLRFSYLEFTAVTAAATVAQFLTFRHWGELSDRFGNKKILNLCGWGVAVVPFLWLFSAGLAYLALIQIYAGVVWAGFSLASANFIFDAIPPAKRARCVAYQGLASGLCVLAGSLAGGWVASRLPAVVPLGFWGWRPEYALPGIFLVSGLLRLAAAGFFLHRFREVRPVEVIRHRELIFRISHLRPLAGATFSLLTELVRDRRPGSPGSGQT